MNTKLRSIPVYSICVEPRQLKIEPEDVELFRDQALFTAYREHCELHGTDRYGFNPEFRWTVRPSLVIVVDGYVV